jgi:hypothetical protein
MTLNRWELSCGILLAGMLGMASLNAGAAVPSNAQAIEGVWDSRVSLSPCADPTIVLASFRALNQFNRHGSLVATSQVAQPPSLGQWKWLGGRRYRAVFRFQRFGAGGVFEGLTQVTRVIRLAPDGKSFTGEVTTALYDLSDSLFATGCGKEEAARIF